MTAGELFHIVGQVAVETGLAIEDGRELCLVAKEHLDNIEDVNDEVDLID